MADRVEYCAGKCAIVLKIEKGCNDTKMNKIGTKFYPILANIGYLLAASCNSVVLNYLLAIMLLN
jgi:hypothetical protein